MVQKIGAIDVLKADHREVEQLFTRFEETAGTEEQQKILFEISQQILIHTMISEEIFYPAIRGIVDDEMLDEMYVKDDGIKILITDLAVCDPGEQFFRAKVNVLREQIELSIESEENFRIGLFAQVRHLKVDLDALGRQISARRRELRESAKAGELPEPMLATMVATEL